MRTSSKLVVTLALVSFAFMAVISSSAFADVGLTTDGKVPGKPFEYLQQQIDTIELLEGPEGPQGPIGPTGPAGADGVQGQAGADGAQGPEGPQGPIGPTGPAGADGVQGQAGADGAQGPIGLAGAQGDTGSMGPQGPTGDTGATGDGPIGLTGPEGPPGADGVDGSCDCPITKEEFDDLIARIEYLESLHSEPAQRFTNMGDGTIRDNKTGLIWLKDAHCFEHSDWDDAWDDAALLDDGQCGLTDASGAGDWRIPTRAEWVAFVSTEYVSPALSNTAGDGQWLEGDAFTRVRSETYWSSSGYMLDQAWCMNLNAGDENYYPDFIPMLLWPVRSDD